MQVKRDDCSCEIIYSPYFEWMNGMIMIFRVARANTHNGTTKPWKIRFDKIKAIIPAIFFRWICIDWRSNCCARVWVHVRLVGIMNLNLIMDEWTISCFTNRKALIIMCSCQQLWSVTVMPLECLFNQVRHTVFNSLSERIVICNLMHFFIRILTLILLSRL